MATLSAKLSAPRASFPAIPDTRELSRDINALQGRLRTLQSMRREIEPPPGSILVMGPGRHARDALDRLGAPDALAALIATYETAIAALSDAHTEADIHETTQRMFASHETARADERRYLRDLIEEYRTTVDARRAPERAAERSAAA